MKPFPLEIEQILCPTDFSIFSSRALRHAVALAQQLGSRLRVVHVIPPLLIYADEPVYLPARTFSNSAMREAAAEEMRRFLEPAAGARVSLQTEIREGQPWREILAAAEEGPADLVVVGTHGHGGFERLLLGSVAEKLLHRLPCPVLTVCHEEGRTWNAPGLVSRVLCAVDFGESTGATVAHAVALAARMGAELTLLHVLETLPDRNRRPYFAVRELEPLREELEKWARQRFREVVSDEARAELNLRERIAAGSAHDEILRIAVEERADLIVLGARSQGPLERLVLGSTAHHVVRAATCPVLTVRSPRVRKARGVGALVAAS